MSWWCFGIATPVLIKCCMYHDFWGFGFFFLNFLKIFWDVRSFSVYDFWLGWVFLCCFCFCFLNLWDISDRANQTNSSAKGWKFIQRNLRSEVLIGSSKKVLSHTDCKFPLGQFWRGRSDVELQIVWLGLSFQSWESLSEMMFNIPPKGSVPTVVIQSVPWCCHTHSEHA